MLTQNNKINIRQFKLSNGEEIIALVNERTDNGSYIIERPFKISPGMVGGFYFHPWFAFSSQKMFKLTKEKILYHVEIDEDIKGEYIKLASEDAQPHAKRQPIRSKDSILDELTAEMEAELELDTLSMEPDTVLH